MSHQPAGSSQPPSLISIAMPVYNADTYLRLAVQSIIKQTYQHWELLIIDDGSTDQCLKSIADIQDPRIRIIQNNSNLGLSVRLNQALALAKGRYFARMDADDVAYPDRLARQVEVLLANPNLDVLATRVITINEHHQCTGTLPYALSHDDICVKPWLGFYFPHPTWMGKIDWFRHYGYTVPAPVYCEDQELLLRSHRQSQWATVDEILLAYRIKSLPNWQKLGKTRWALCTVQQHIFADNRQWGWFCLSTLAWLARSLKDHIRKRCIRNTSYHPLHQIDEIQLSRWQNILVSLTTEVKTP